MIRLNLGAGKQVLDGWITVGLEPSHHVHSDVRKLPFEDGYADQAMAVHVLEHIQRWESLDTLREWRRVLKPGGSLAIELPDLRKCCRNFLATSDIRLSVFGFYGDPKYKTEDQVHKWCYTVEELSELLREAGFNKIREARAQFHKPIRDMRIEARA